MKKHLIIFLLVITFGVSHSGCANMEIKPSNNYITRNFKIVNGFDKLNITTVGDVNFTQSTDGTFSVSVYGPDNIIDLLEVAVDDKTLKIGISKRVNNVKKMKITISSPELYAINFTGVGNIHMEDGLETGDFNIENHGVGDIHIKNLSCKDITIHSSAVGNIFIKGKAEKATIHSNGVGNIKASELQAKDVKVSTNGVGNISCYASESIIASNVGVGNITYGGNPEKKDLSNKGVGKIKAQ